MLESTATSEFWMLSKWPSEIVHARAARLSCRRFRQECMCMECASLRRWGHVPWSVISLALHNCKFSNSRTEERPQLRSESSRSPPVLTKTISMLPKNLGTLENSWEIILQVARKNFDSVGIFMTGKISFLLKKKFLDAPKFVRIFFPGRSNTFGQFLEFINCPIIL